MDQYEVLIYIRGYQRRYERMGEMLAHFTSMVIAPNYKKGKQPKPRDLWRSPIAAELEKREKKKADVVSLEEHRLISKAFRDDGPPPVSLRKG